MLICRECESIFNEDELKIVHEPRGEFWGIPCTEPMAYCPYCGSEWIEDYNEEEEEEDDI